MLQYAETRRRRSELSARMRPLAVPLLQSLTNDPLLNGRGGKSAAKNRALKSGAQRGRAAIKPETLKRCATSRSSLFSTFRDLRELLWQLRSRRRVANLATCCQKEFDEFTVVKSETYPGGSRVGPLF